MGLNSCLYETTISHRRLVPVGHAFSYKFFSFYLDLDEIDTIVAHHPLMSRNRFNVYSFYDRDHMNSGAASVKENVLRYLQSCGVDIPGGRIMLLTYLRFFGYVFNPVSFYFCFDRQSQPVCVVPEIGNTFGEIKPFLVNAQKDGRFVDTQNKFFYISPFNKLDDQLDYKLAIPSEHLNIHIDTSRDGQKVMLAAVSGVRRELTPGNLAWLTMKFPFVTLKVISLIHWHAGLLWLKKVPYEEKFSNPHLQKEVLRAR